MRRKEKETIQGTKEACFSNSSNFFFMDLSDSNNLKNIIIITHRNTTCPTEAIMIRIREEEGRMRGGRMGMGRFSFS